ncbi:MAG: helix-turn-helix domain-containing protein [Alphaproteobacteria bacterium]|nr:helix-turn-helix domain-containing protein [Alphaproteobacteria bacterium]MCL2504679.1 helix-turn-helix domain-containing protein [Alphaproteobacteria bacterium]
MSIGRQISAARNLLLWNISEFSDKTGLTKDTLKRIEESVVQPQANTLKEIQKVFDENGVEFTENFGVRFKPENITVLKGPDGLREFFDDVYNYVSNNGNGDILQTGDDSFFTSNMGEYIFVHAERMTKLANARKDVCVRALLYKKEGTIKECGGYTQYRYLPQDIFGSVNFYLYGDRLAIITSQTVPSPFIVTHKIPELTEGYRKQFDFFWEQAEPV